MSHQTSTPSTGGISFAGLLTIVFVTLKLCSVITWSWWWVLSPLWLPLALVLVVAFLYALVSLILDR
jgi:hypothetical protein